MEGGRLAKFQLPLGRLGYAGACRSVAELLADGPVPAKQAQAVLEAAGIGEKTIREARKELGIKPYQQGRKHWWKLPRKNSAV